jgi:hypothetical protein
MKELDAIITRDTNKADTLLQTKQDLEIKNQELYSTMQYLTDKKRTLDEDLLE